MVSSPFWSTEVARADRQGITTSVSDAPSGQARKAYDRCGHHINRSFPHPASRIDAERMRRRQGRSRH